MADIAPQPFINYGLSQAQQGQANASAQLEQQQAGLVNQQAQQAAMATELQQRAMPLYRQTIDDMMADMSGTAANSNSRSSNSAQMPGVPGQTGDTSGVSSNATPANKPEYADSGAIAEHVRNQNWVEPVTQGEMRAINQGAIMAMAPGGSPMWLERAKLQQQLRVQYQTNAAQYRSGQTYDVMTAIADPNNQNPLGMLAATPGQEAVAARIANDYKGDPEGAQAAARHYAQLTGFHVHQYTGNPTDMNNGVLVDTRKGAPVTGQEQVLTGLNPEQRNKATEYYYQPIDVTLRSGEKTSMPRYAAPVEQGGLGGITLGQYLTQQDTLARGKDPAIAGATSWNATAAPGNTPAGQKAVAAGQPRGPAQQPPSPAGTNQMTPPGPGAKPAVGAQLRQLQNNPTPPPGPPANPGNPPAYGSPQYSQYEQSALRDPDFKSIYAPQNARRLNQPGLPEVGAKEGVKQYQDDAKTLRDYGTNISQVAGTSLMNLQAAKKIIEAGDNALPMTGAVGAAMSWMAANGFDTRTAQGRQEGAKYLINFALSSLKDTYGSRPAAFDVKINTEQAFPSLEKMGIGEVHDLIDSQIKQATYLKQSGERAARYANGGSLQPGNFSTWNEKYFPKEQILGSGKNPPSDAETRSYQGSNYYLPKGADRSKRENWVKY